MYSVAFLGIYSADVEVITAESMRDHVRLHC